MFWDSLGEGLGTLQYKLLGEQESWQSIESFTDFQLLFDLDHNGCQNPYNWNALSGRMGSTIGGLDNIRLEWERPLPTPEPTPPTPPPTPVPTPEPTVSCGGPVD